LKGTESEMMNVIVSEVNLHELAISELIFARNCGAVLRDAIAVYLL